MRLSFNLLFLKNDEKLKFESWYLYYVMNMCNVRILVVLYDYDVYVASIKVVIENNECGGNNSQFAILSIQDPIHYRYMNKKIDANAYQLDR